MGRRASLWSFMWRFLVIRRWFSHRNVAAIKRCHQVCPLCVCWVSRWITTTSPSCTCTHTCTHCRSTHSLLMCVWFVFLFFSGSGQRQVGATEDEESCKSQIHIRSRYTPQNIHAHMHIPVLFPLLTAFLCQNTCLIWSSTLTRWRSCRSTVTQTERRRLAPPSAAWRTFPKSSSLPWKTWWVIATKHLLQLMSFYLKICNFSLKKPLKWVFALVWKYLPPSFTESLMSRSA